MKSDILAPHGHFLFSPSGAKRWLSCTAAPVLSLRKPVKDDDTAYSRQGDIAHKIAADVLTGTVRRSEIPDEIMGLTGCKRLILEYVDFCEELAADNPDCVALVETAVPLFYAPERPGYVDFGLYSTRKIVVVDLKFGAGIPVSPIWNPQQMSYAAGLIMLFREIDSVSDDTPVDIWIVQPRSGVEPEPAVFETSVGQLRKWGATVMPAVDAIVHDVGMNLPFAGDGDEPILQRTRFRPSVENCCTTLCPHAGSCRAMQEAIIPAIIEQGGEDTAHLRLRLQDDDEERMKMIYTNKKLFMKIVKECGAKLWAVAQAGAIPQGLKMVRGREGRRAWKAGVTQDQISSEFALEEEKVVVTKLVSPAEICRQVESKTLEECGDVKPKKGWKKKISEAVYRFVFRKPAGLSLVPESDPREAVQSVSEKIEGFEFEEDSEFTDDDDESDDTEE